MDTNTHTVHQQRVNAFLSFLFFWSALVFVVATRLSRAAASGSPPVVAVLGLLIAVVVHFEENPL